MITRNCNHAVRSVTFSLLFIICSSCALADIINLKSGQKEMGLIIRDQSDLPTVTIKTSKGEIAIPREKIDRIETEPKAISLMRLADQYLDKEQYAQAADYYRMAIEIDSKNADIAAKLKQAEAGIAEREAVKLELNLAKVDEAMLSARALAQQGKYDQAVALLKENDPGKESSKATEHRKTMADVYTLWGISRLDHQDHPGAAEKLKLALKLDPENQQARIHLAKVWEGDPTKLDDIIEFYSSSTAPEDQLKLADALFKQRKYERALPIYVKYVQEPQYTTAIMSDRIRQMYEVLHKQYADEGNYAKAIETYDAFLNFLPESERDLLPLAKYEYMQKRAATDMNDANARAELARFAEESALAGTAKEEYRNVLKMDPKNAIAAQGLRRYAQAGLDDAQELFKDQQYLLASQRAAEVAKEYGSFAEIVKSAQEIQAKAEVEQEKQQRNNQQQAVALALRGDDYYQQALGYLSAYVSTNVDRNIRVFSPRHEAGKFFARAIMAWQSALKIDPSLGAPTSYDLRNKIADANAKYASLMTAVPARLPSRDLNRTHRSQNSTEGSL